MTAIDSNVLIAAHRGEHILHRKAVAILRDLAENSIPWALPAFCIPEFVRVVTHPRIFSPPSTLVEAFLFVERLLPSPSLRMLMPEKRFWHHFRNAATQGNAVGNLAFDAQIAAVCLEHGVVELVTADRDFNRFPGMKPLILTP